ncbi:MAG TPA: HAD family hydrolase [Ktedonobacteraceae bacterium]|nr:HAD family hydrolase [Ktedonobacteraceae bacterium]
MRLEQPQAIRTIFFDVGFTLLYTYPSDHEICQRVCARLGLHIHLDQLKTRLVEAEDFFLRHMRANRHVWASDARIEDFWLTYYMNLLRPLVEEHDEKRLLQLASALYHEYDSHTSWQLYPDVLPTLEALRASGRYTLGAISDWGISLGPILQRLQLNSYFEHLLISALTGHAKPSPSLYEMALARANSVADYSLHIGDSYTLDVLGARAVGMIPVLLDRKRQLTPDQVDCLLIHSLSDILTLLEIEA